MLGDFPPSSRDTLFRLDWAEYCCISFPTWNTKVNTVCIQYNITLHSLSRVLKRRLVRETMLWEKERLCIWCTHLPCRVTELHITHYVAERMDNAVSNYTLSLELHITSVEPVNPILSTSMCMPRAWPAVCPYPDITFNTPAGNPTWEEMGIQFRLVLTINAIKWRHDIP